MRICETPITNHVHAMDHSLIPVAADELTTAEAAATPDNEPISDIITQKKFKPRTVKLKTYNNQS